MIEPVLTGSDLVEAIQTAQPPQGGASVWRLGQAGFVLKFASATVLVDPYLSNHCEALLAAPLDHRRETRSPLDAAEVLFGDVVICSHDHCDHLDVATIRTLARQLPRAQAIAPAVAGPALRALGWGPERVVMTRHGDRVEVAGLLIDAFAVPHEDFDEDPELGHPYQGYVVSDGGVSIAHLGDSVSHPWVVEALRDLDVDLLLAPINGRSPQRAALGFAGNTNAAEAVDLASAAGVRHLIPMHYDMFAQNVDANALASFTASATDRGLAHSVLGVGERFDYAT